MTSNSKKYSCISSGDGDANLIHYSRIIYQPSIESLLKSPDLSFLGHVSWIGKTQSPMRE